MWHANACRKRVSFTGTALAISANPAVLSRQLPVLSRKSRRCWCCSGDLPSLITFCSLSKKCRKRGYDVCGRASPTPATFASCERSSAAVRCHVSIAYDVNSRTSVDIQLNVDGQDTRTQAGLRHFLTALLLFQRQGPIQSRQNLPSTSEVFRRAPLFVLGRVTAMRRNMRRLRFHAKLASSATRTASSSSLVTVPRFLFSRQSVALLPHSSTTMLLLQRQARIPPSRMPMRRRAHQWLQLRPKLLASTWT